MNLLGSKKHYTVKVDKEKSTPYFKSQNHNSLSKFICYILFLRMLS